MNNSKFYVSKSTGRRLFFFLMALLLGLIPLFTNLLAVSAEGEIDWIATIASEHSRPADTYTVTTALAPDGSVYMLGDTDGVMGDQTQVGNSDLFLQKYTSTGELVWVRQFGSIESDGGGEIAADSSGVYVVGQSWGSFDELPNPDLVGAVFKFDPDGNLLWIEEIGTNYQVHIHGIALTSDSLYVAGWTYGSFEDPNAPIHSADSFLRKYSLDGVLQWSRSYGGEYTDQADGVAADESGAYVAGYYATKRNVMKFSPQGDVLWSNDWMTDTMGNLTGYNIAVAGSRVYLAGQTLNVLPGETPVGDWDVYIITFDAANGSLGWLHQFGTPNGDFFSSLVADDTGVTIAGSTVGSFDGYTNAGAYDGFVRRYNPDGSEAGTFQFGTPATDGISGIAVDGTGIYAAGQTNGALDGQASSGVEDIFLKKVDLSFIPLWTRQFNTTSYIPENEFGWAVDASGDIYLAGYISLNTEDYSYIKVNSVFLAKYSPDGTRQWMDTFNSVTEPGASRNDQATSVAVDAQGNAYLTGYVSGILPGQTGGGWYTDAFLRKYAPDGTVLWTRQFGTDRSDPALQVAVFEDVIYVAGMTQGQMGASAYGGNDIYISLFSPEGDCLGVEQFGSSASDTLTSLAVDESGLYVGLTTTGALDGFTNAGSYDGYLRKYNPDGSLAWTQQLASTGGDSIYAVTLYESNLYIAGSTTGSLTFGADVIENDTFIQKFSPDGEVLWSQPLGVEARAYPRGIAADSTGAYMVGYGFFNGNLNQSFLYKYSLEGEQAWLRLFDSQTEIGGARGVAIEDSALYIAGTIQSLNHFRSQDAVLLRMSLGVENQAPEVGVITAPAGPVAVNTEIAVSASFTDANTSDTHTATWDWGNGTNSAGSIVESSGSGTASGTNTYTEPGVYEIRLTVADQAGLEGSATYQYVVVYDPSAGFVTGGGWINSPAGAFAADQSLEGKATFGFVSKYQKGASVPTGNTAFQFDLAGLAFASQNYEWLVVNQGGMNAQFKGSGLINGSADANGNPYKFMLWAADGSPDTFQIRIWWEDAAGEHDVYDNGTAQAVGGGSIVVHTGK